jgi:two-component system, cell cycle sensor histidine kinase and response regulator CckA
MERQKTNLQDIKDGRAGDGLFVTAGEDYDSQCFIDVNEDFCELLGYSKKELLGLSLSSLGDFSQEQAAGSGQHIFLSAQLNSSSGEVIPTEIKIDFLNIDGKEIAIGTVWDKRQQIKEGDGCLESEEKFQILMEHTVNWEYWLLPDGNFAYVSPSCEAISGYSSEEFIENPNLLFEIAAPQFKEMLLFHHQQEKLSEQSSVEFIIVRKDGIRRWIHHSCKPIYDEAGNYRGRRGTNIDINEAKEYESQLNMYNALIEQSPISIVVTDLAGYILYVNPYFLARTGYSESEVIGKHTRFLKSGRTGPELYKTLWQTISSGKVWKGEMENIDKQGQLFWEMVTITPLTDLSGNIYRYMAMKEDITQRKIIQGQLNQAQKLEIVGQFTSGIAHDFNNLLTAISGFAQIALMDDEDNQNLKTILGSAHRGADLVSKLMGFVRNQSFTPSPLNMNNVISDIEKLISRVIGEDIRLSVKLSDGIPPVYADISQIEQIIMNLVVNARDAIRENKQVDNHSISVSTEKKQFSSEISENGFLIPAGEYVMLNVSDTGVGIDPEFREKVFEPLFTTKEKGKGTGLGLSTVIQILQQNNAYIAFNSARYVGTSFSIFWPAFKGKKPFRVKSDVKPEKINTEKIIAVVDDDPDILLVLRSGLEKFGIKAHFFFNSMEAMKKIPLLQPPVDILLTDVVMPQVNGPQLGAHLQEILPNLKVIFMSGYPKEYIGELFLNDRKTEHISKPFDLLEIVKLLGSKSESDE